MYLTQGLHRALQRHPHRLALRDAAVPGDPGLDYAGLLPRVARLAAALQAQGVVAGDRVALLSPNSAGLVQQLLACWWLGAAVVPLSPHAAPADLRQALAASQARLLLVHPALAWLSSQVGLATALPAAATEMDAAALAAQAAGLQGLDDSRTGGPALAALLFTAGTTGRPQAVMLTHANLWTAALAQAAELPVALRGPQPLCLLATPLCHVAALGRLLLQTLLGGGCLTLPQFQPDTVLAALDGQGVTDLLLAPRQLAALLDAPGFDAARLQGVQRISHGLTPMPPQLLLRARAAWPRAELVATWGLTESAGAVCLRRSAPLQQPSQTPTSAPQAPLAAETVGPAGLGAELRIADAQGASLPAGQAGQILLRGPMVMAGYWQQPEASRAALHGGWLHTGDAGRIDAQGELVVIDRICDIVVSGGEKVYPTEVEAVLRLHPAVADVAVLGLDHPVWGQAVHAVVVLARGALPQPEALRRHCRQHLAGYKCPRSVSFAAGLPLSATGQVQKPLLRQALLPASHPKSNPWPNPGDADDSPAHPRLDGR